MVDRNRLLRIVVPAVLLGVAGVLAFVRLEEPARIIFDETYYVNDARQYLVHGVEEGFAVHPPVGKWLIAAGIEVLGDTPVGWRVPGAAAGALSVLLTYLIGLRVFGRIGPAALAGLLLATDGLFLVQARTSMLDIFLALFTVLGAWLLLVDRDRSGLGDAPPPRVDDLTEHADDDAVSAEEAADAEVTDAREEAAPVELPRRGHPYRVLAGVAFGLAIATKWSGLMPLAAAFLVALVWELAWRRRWTGRMRTGAGRAIGSLAVGLVLVPLTVYALTWVPWLVNYPYTHEGGKECETAEDVLRDPCPVSPVGRLAGLGRYHEAILRFHLTLEAEHPYRAPAYTWPIMARPVVYYYETCSEDRANGVYTENDDGKLVPPEPCVVEQGDTAEIIAVGNPALWWGFLAATGLLAAGLARRDRRAWFVAAFWGMQFLPWLIVARPAFFFYMVPVVPFLALGIGYAATVLDEERPLVGPVTGGALGAALGFAAGFGFEALVDAETTTARWVALGIGWFLGAAVGDRIDRKRTREVVPRRMSRGALTGALLAVVAVVLLVYFLPVWTGLPMDADAVRQRWWFNGWI